MMAADTVNHHSYCNHLSLPSGLTSGNQHHNQDELVDHGSVSFGRFVVESLAWEKWSVFSHNRCQEEIEKFKSPGLVAQKKAFFEEYYRNIRAMKKLQLEQQEQETIQSDLGQGGENIMTESQEQKNTASHEENSVEFTESEEEKKFDDAIQVSFPVETNHDRPVVVEEQPTNNNDNIIDGEIKILSVEDESEEQTNNNEDSMIKLDDSKICSTSSQSDDFANKADQIPTSSVKTRLKASQKDSVVSGKSVVKKSRDCASLSKAKGEMVTTLRDKTKLYRTKKEDAVKQPGKQKSLPAKESRGKIFKNQILSERTALKPTRPPIKPESGVILPPHTSVRRERRLPSSNLKGGVPRSSVTLPRTSVPKERAMSSSSLKGGVAKTNLNPQCYMSKMQNTSKLQTRTIGASVNNVRQGKRAIPGDAKKPVELSRSRLTIPKGGLSDDQKPKSMSINLSAPRKLTDNIGKEVGLNNDDRVDRSKEVSISELVDHGSISFGRFAAESLEWEKWSVFSNNRCREELEKFKFPGLVAQKKEFFEEHYKKIAAKKKLQEEQQETIPSDLCQDEKTTNTHGQKSVDFKSTISHIENNVDTGKSKEEKKFDDAFQSYFLAETNNDKSLGTEGQLTSHSDIVVEMCEIEISSATVDFKEQSNSHDDSMVKVDKTNICSTTNKSEDFANKDMMPSLSINTCSKALQKDNVVSEKTIDKKLRDHEPCPRAKVVEMPRSSVTLPYTSVPKERPSSPSSSLNPRSTVTHSQTSVPKKRPASSSGLRGSLARTNLNPKCVTSKVVEIARSSVTLPYTSVPSERPSSSSSSLNPRSAVTHSQTSVPKKRPASSSGLRGGLARTNLNPRGVMSKCTGGASVNTVPGKRDTPGVAKNSLELSSSRLAMPKRGLLENQSSKFMSTNQSARNTLGKNFSSEIGFTNDVTSRTKIVPWRSVDLTHAQRELRSRTPTCRR